jgi:uncharacterized protein
MVGKLPHVESSNPGSRGADSETMPGKAKGMTSGRAGLAVLASVAVLATLLVAASAPAQEDPSGTSYITPFPEGDTYRMQVYGDAFAEGLIGGLTEAFSTDGRAQAPRRHRTLAGITRADFEEEVRKEEAESEPVHIGVVMIGVSDRNHMRTGPRERVLLGSPEWREEYGRRVDRLIKVLKKRGVALYWVGQPIMRRYETNDPAQTMNDIVREKSYLNGIRYIDIQAQFADESGNYTAWGPDIAGKQRLLRENDGVLFTPAGYRKLAYFVESEIKRDMNQAKTERTIPLAGSESEQKRVAAQRAAPAPSQDAPWRGTVNASKEGKGAVAAKGAAAEPAEQKADNGRITLKTIGAGGREEAVTIDIPRPAISAAVVQLMTRKESSDRASQIGDVLADDVGGGLVVQNTVTPTVTGPGAARRASPALAHNQVWIKGERLPPKPGRADDFSWPKAEPEIAAEPVPTRRPPRGPASKSSPRS